MGGGRGRGGDGGKRGGGRSQTLKRLPRVSTGDVPFMTMEIGAIVIATRLGQAQSSACMIASRHGGLRGLTYTLASVTASTLLVYM